ncbi:hypothetical protein ACHAW5_008335 [Stephanodiscus triporus]|uniref:EF-hand domain-containing protein n=1 Tax=Stephanodiscus triporus TaxID=2934178 RepID=A0ABD3PAX8_9STRA
MSDNNNVTEIEEGVIEGTEPIQATSSNLACTKRAATRLSMVSKQYDIDGDGVLDPAELAMRKLDTSGRGFLTNEKVYALMQEQLAMQKSMFQMKKIIAG